MSMRPLATLACMLLASAPGMADSHRHAPRTALEKEVAELFRAQADIVRCDTEHFIYGVGYIDGSYMERIFYVEDGGGPQFTVQFRGAGLPDVQPGGAVSADVGPAAFVIELRAPRSLHAVPHGDGWRVSDEGWETALRFKYTSWYGQVRREAGEWLFDWQGYRRPMLPAADDGNADRLCAMFAGH